MCEARRLPPRCHRTHRSLPPHHGSVLGEASTRRCVREAHRGHCDRIEVWWGCGRQARDRPSADATRAPMSGLSGPIRMGCGCGMWSTDIWLIRPDKCTDRSLDRTQTFGLPNDKAVQAACSPVGVRWITSGLCLSVQPPPVGTNLPVKNRWD
jgi:hypothetical protein